MSAALAVPEEVVRVVAGGRRRGHPQPDPAQLRGRVVALKSGPHLQLQGTTGPRVSTHNIAYGDGFADRIAPMLAGGYASWRVETLTRTLQVRVTKKGRALVHTGPPPQGTGGAQPHDRPRERLIDPDDPIFAALGADGAKRRQVDAFVRNLQTTLDRAQRRRAVSPGALTVVDLGCGNAYLTMAAHRYLTRIRPGTRTVGVELRPDLVQRSTVRAHEAGLDGLDFVTGSIDAVGLDDLGLDRVDVVLALHACDTATDQALAQAVHWQAPVVLAAPCCHHDVQRQLTESGAQLPGLGSMLRRPILRERFADLLTDELRAAVLTSRGYRIDLVEFVDSAHTPRNLMLRAVRTAERGSDAELTELLDTWQVQPALLRLLATAD